MEKLKLDLSNNANAEISRNKTAMICVLVMNAILCIAYLLEVVKGVRTIGSYLLLLSTCIVPCAISLLVYLKKKDSRAIRYISGIGFLVLYTYIMFTPTSDLVFCYVLVIFSAFLVYVDLKISLLLGASAIVINIAVILKKIMTVGLSAEDVTNAEIIVACLIMTCVFAVLAIKKVTQIGQANVDRADLEKEQSDKLLQTTLEVANSITGNIEVAVAETGNLSSAIDTTQQSMKELTNGTNDTMQAIMKQQESTNEIDAYIREVEDSTEQIAAELTSAEENLNVGHEVMNELLEQVKVSESSSVVAAREIEGLRENADKMQNIVGLISSVANQTSMLALNASIEAARAGEAGRGFAVVATEISGLAAQTNNATGDINKLIANITKSITEVTTAMEALLESNRFQNEYVARTADNFNKIHNSNREISSHAELLKQTVRAVAEANTQVVQNIDNVSAVTEEVTASANETLNSCNMNLESIERVVQIMKKLGDEAEKLKQE